MLWCVYIVDCVLMMRMLLVVTKWLNLKNMSEGKFAIMLLE